MSIDVGKRVQSVSGGPHLEVVAIEGENAVCAYWTKGKTPIRKECTVPKANLVEVKRHAIGVGSGPNPLFGRRR